MSKDEHTDCWQLLANAPAAPAVAARTSPSIIPTALCSNNTSRVWTRGWIQEELQELVHNLSTTDKNTDLCAIITQVYVILLYSNEMQAKASNTPPQYAAEEGRGSRFG